MDKGSESAGKVLLPGKLHNQRQSWCKTATIARKHLCARNALDTQGEPLTSYKHSWAIYQKMSWLIRTMNKGTRLIRLMSTMLRRHKGNSIPRTTKNSIAVSRKGDFIGAPGCITGHAPKRYTLHGTCCWDRSEIPRHPIADCRPHPSPKRAKCQCQAIARGFGYC